MMAETTESIDLKPTNGVKATMTEDSTNSKAPSQQQDTNQKADETKSQVGTQFLAAGIASLTGFMMGQMVSWSSPVTPLLIKNQTITKDEESWIVSILNFGAIIGCLLAGSVNKLMGRKTILLIICIPEIVSWLLLAFCEGAMILCFARFVGGMCVGFICVNTPMYIAEIAQPSVRGALATLFQLSITIGVLYTFILGTLNNALQITLCSSVIVLIFFGLFIWMPESPVYLLLTDRPKEASASLQWLRGHGYDIYHERRLLEASVQESKEVNASYSDFIADKGTFKALIIAVGLFVFQQLSGINVVIFYMQTVFEAAGSTVPLNQAVICIGIVQMLATGLSVVLIDRAGRRVLFIFSLCACSVCLFILGVYFYLKSISYDISSLGWLPVVSVASYLVLFAMGLGPVPWAIVGEIFNKNISGLATSVVTAAHWALAFLVTKVYSTCEEYLGTGQTFWMFACWCVVGVVFVWILVPETKGRDVQDIVDELKGKPKSEIPSTA